MAKFRLGGSGNSLQKGKITDALGAAFNASSGAESGVSNPTSSRVAEGALIQGELTFSSNLYFSGRLDGLIQAQEGKLELSRSGKVHGDIDCQAIDCYGEVSGNIISRKRSILRSECKLIGDIETAALSIQNGAQISGHCKMLGDQADLDLFSMPVENLRKYLKSGK